MIEYARILFPLDFSESAPLVAEHVAAVARRFESQVHVLNVVPAYDGPNFPSYSRVMGEIKKQVDHKLETFIARRLSSLEEVIPHVLVGHTGRRILEFIDHNDISLVIMGTHGRSGVGRLFFGSVAQRVVQGSRVPVMTVHPE